MENNSWTQSLRRLYDHAVTLRRQGPTDPNSCFSEADRTFLASIGLKPIHVLDFAEDFVDSGEPDWDTFLLVAAARRDYFLYEQDARPNPAELASSDLPARDATLGGLPWLPRIIQKARCFLEGGLCHDIMFCCAGDRKFLRKHNLHPADFLRAVWAARCDDQRLLAFVEKASRPS
jgi:hypothetical protein